MGDNSDDEYGNRRERSHKFRSERYDDRRDWDNRGGGWNPRGPGRDDRYGGSGPRRDAYGRNPRDQGYGSPRDSRDQSPPNKRRRGGGGGGGEYETDGFGRDSSRHHEHNAPPDNSPTQPPMASFKQYLSKLDDNIDDSEAVKKYNVYKLEFKKKQSKDFFEKHKDEEWFRMKYHPEEMPHYLEEKKEQVKRRLQVFNELLQKGWLDVSLDEGNMDNIIRILDAAVIKLEGGNDDDLKVLDTKLEEKEQTKSDVDACDSLFSVDTETKPVKNEHDQENVNGAQKQETKEDEVIKTENSDESCQQKSEETTGPLLLHKTTSIFFRNLPPNITREEVKAVCEKLPGFLRLCLAEPQVERKFFRRGWATFKNNVPIKKFIFGMQSLSFHNANCGAIQNRDLTRRIRWANGLASNMNTIRADVRNAAKIIYNLDKQRGLWVDETKEAACDSFELKTTFAEDSKNPLLQNITEYLVEEANAEEEELLGIESGELEPEEAEGSSNASFQRDDKLIKILDRMIYYLRIVHSLDYYQATDYPQEDKMPNRIGIMHCRGPTPTSKVTQKEINEYTCSFETKLKPFLESPTVVTEEDAAQLGVSTEDEAEEAYIKSLIKEPKPGKFECTLEGKKFKGEEFVVKHIKTKHPVELTDVRKNSVYYRYYIMDPKRPQLPEHPSNRPQQQTPSKDTRSFDKMPSAPPYLPLPQMPWGGYGGGGNPGFYGGYGGGGPRHPGYGMGGPMGGNFRGGFAPTGGFQNRRAKGYFDLDNPGEELD